MDTPPTAAPGWYPDPNKLPTLRWWDGAAWTEQLAPASPPPVQGDTGPGTNPPFWKAQLLDSSMAKIVAVAVVVGLGFGGYQAIHASQRDAQQSNCVAEQQLHSLDPVNNPAPDC